MSINTSAKRLTEVDATAIFESLTNDEHLPEGLKFKIIRVPVNGLRLSPPSFEFDDGLYVLLRSSDDKIAHVPSKLSDKLLNESDLARMQSCPWSLSGPQYPKRKKIQQRYCYPRGNPVYSEGKGGAIWTKLDSDGKEDVNCRILHVYHSNKRTKPKSKPTTKLANHGVARPIGVTPCHLKRKNNGGGQHKHKKNKVNENLEQVLKCPSLLQDNVLKSAKENLEQGLKCPSLLQDDVLKSPSYEFDSSLDFNCENLFATDTQVTSSFDESLSFIPVSSEDIEDVMKNDPEFNSAARSSSSTQQHHPTANGYYYGPYARHPHYAYGGRHWHYGDWTRAAPSIPQLKTSEHRTDDRDLGHFSKRLQRMEESVMADIRNSTAADQALKLHLLQKWANAIAQKPLQPQKAPRLAHVPQVNIKIESPGTPNETP